MGNPPYLAQSDDKLAAAWPVQPSYMEMLPRREDEGGHAPSLQLTTGCVGGGLYARLPNETRVAVGEGAWLWGYLALERSLMEKTTSIVPGFIMCAHGMERGSDRCDSIEGWVCGTR